MRFEVGYYALKPDIKVIAPWREWDLNSRTKLIEYAEAKGIPVPMVGRSSGQLVHRAVACGHAVPELAWPGVVPWWSHDGTAPGPS